MAVIENLSSPKAVADWEARFATMPASEMLAQQICQRGAVHALASLKEVGVTPENLQFMLDSCRQALFTLEEAAHKRGVILMSYNL